MSVTSSSATARTHCGWVAVCSAVTQVLFCPFLSFSVLFCPVPSCRALLCHFMFCSVLFCSVLFCSVLFCSVLFCSVLFCSVLSPPVFFLLLLCTYLVLFGPHQFPPSLPLSLPLSSNSFLSRYPGTNRFPAYRCALGSMWPQRHG